MGAGNKCVLLRFILQLLYGFFLFGHVTSLRCNNYLMSLNVQNGKVSNCTTQGPEYCYTFLITDNDGEITHEELGCLPDEGNTAEFYCGGEDIKTEEGVLSVTCCNEHDYCNTKVVPLPGPTPSPSTPPLFGIPIISWSGYLTAAVVVAGLTAVFVVVMSAVSAVYFYWWKRHYSRLKAAQANSITASYTSNGSSRGSESTSVYV